MSTKIEWETNGPHSDFHAAEGESGEIEITASEGSLVIECGDLYLEINVDGGVDRAKSLAEAFLPHVLAMTKVKTSELDALTKERGAL